MENRSPNDKRQGPEIKKTTSEGGEKSWQRGTEHPKREASSGKESERKSEHSSSGSKE